jgi:hypothetical protein
MTHISSTVVVQQPDIVSAVVVPTEHDPPLFVDPDRMKALELALQSLETVSGRRCEIH